MNHPDETPGPATVFQPSQPLFARRGRSNVLPRAAFLSYRVAIGAAVVMVMGMWTAFVATVRANYHAHI